MKAIHALEIPFKFNHPDEWAQAAGQRPGRFQVAANMSRVVNDPFREERLVWQKIEKPEPNPS
jgi:hypothetical protein